MGNERDIHNEAMTAAVKKICEVLEPLPVYSKERVLKCVMILLGFEQP